MARLAAPELKKQVIIVDAVSISAEAIRGSPLFVDMIYGAAILPEQNDGEELEVVIDNRRLVRGSPKNSPRAQRCAHQVRSKTRSPVIVYLKLSKLRACCAFCPHKIIA